MFFIKQNNSGIKSKQKEVLELEQKYFNKLFTLVSSDTFKNDLLKVESDIQSNYTRYENIWNLKNKLKIAAERLVTHHVYTDPSFSKNISGLYPSAVSSDIGLQMDDVILCIDVKTNDLSGNQNDFNKMTVEKNQISFNNKKIPIIPTESNLDSRSQYSPYLPILTLIVKIGYYDNNLSFNLVKNDPNYPTLQVACIPNGILSSLFDYNIISGFKTYSYSSEPGSILYFDTTEDALNHFNNDPDYIQILNKAFLNTKSNDIWRYTSVEKRPCMRILISGNTARLDKESLTERLDGNGKPWLGYKTLIIQ